MYSMDRSCFFGRICVYVYMHTYIRTYVHTYIRAYMHTCIRAYVHTWIHTYHYIALHCTTFHYIALHYITLHFITLHCITLYYITLIHYINILHQQITSIHTYHEYIHSINTYIPDRTVPYHTVPYHTIHTYGNLYMRWTICIFVRHQLLKNNLAPKNANTQDRMFFQKMNTKSIALENGLMIDGIIVLSESCTKCVLRIYIIMTTALRVPRVGPPPRIIKGVNPRLLTAARYLDQFVALPPSSHPPRIISGKIIQE